MPNNLEPPPYKLYRSGPKGLKARLRGEEDLGLGPERPGPERDGRPGRRRWYRGRLTWKRGLLYLATAVVAWLLLSLVLFMISAQIESGKVPNSAKAALSSGGNMLTSTDTVLILGTDQRPKGSKEPGANTNDAGSRSDTIMLWRIGGGTSRRLSIPRDTVVPIPGHGDDKINAAYAYGGPALAIKTVEAFARNEGVNLKINHLIIVNLAAFPDFINAIGGVTVKTGRVCSEISGGVKNGGYTLNLHPGTHHLNGIQALTYARTRENRCNPADSDLTRVQHQQQILNGVKSQLFSPGTFFRLPWASWYAPKVLRTDMGGPTLLSLFAASELGGSAPVKVLKVTSSGTGTGLSPAPGAAGQFHQLLNG